jgi:hypothetical protein
MPIQNNILVSHESPLCLLSESRQYNDFDYALVHLFDEHPEYLQFFKDSINVYNRDVLLDNSLFELGKAFDSRLYMKRAEELKPTMLIVPDVFQDCAGTIQSYKDFINEYRTGLIDINTIKIGAVHGRTWQEMLDCYKFMAHNADLIAISFDFEYYQATGEGYTRPQKAITGRQRFISQLIECGAWAWNKPHHLLGCSLPQEFSYYRHNNIYSIRSVDTSNPIVHGMFNIKYQGSFGLKDKCNTKLADLMSASVDIDQKDIIKYNVSQFQKILNG